MLQYDLTLTVIQGRNSGDKLTFNLDAGAGLHLGRGRENDLVIPDPKVSKLHAFIELTEKGPKLFDLKSTSGTILMGFPVGTDGEQLKPFDEFKLANTVLSIDWEKKELSSAPSAKSPSKFELGSRNSKLAIGALVILFLLALLLDLTSSSSPTVTQSKGPVEFSETKGYGYFKGGDHSHPYEVKLQIPPGDLNIEFVAKAALPVTIFRDDVLVGRIGVSDNWDRYSLILRDQLDGDNGILKFVGNAPGKDLKIKEWVVGKIRYRELEGVRSDPKTESSDNSQKLVLVIDGLQETLQSCLTMFSTSDGMWNAKTSLQKMILKILSLTGEQGVLVPIFEDSPTPSISRYETEVSELLVKETKPLSSSSDLNRVLETKEAKLIELLSELESELWRRALNRMNSSVLAAKAENYRQALLDRLNLEQSFPDQQDLRFKETRAQIDAAIPKSVLKKSDKFLREIP